MACDSAVIPPIVAATLDHQATSRMQVMSSDSATESYTLGLRGYRAARVTLDAAAELVLRERETHVYLT